MALLSRTWSVYPSARGHLKASTIDVGSDTFKAVLLSGSYTPGTLTATQRSDVAAYALGTDQTVSLSNSSGTVSTSASASWSGSLSPRYVAIYSDTHASDALLCVVDLGGVNGAGNFTLPAQTLFTFDELTVSGGDNWLGNLPGGMTLLMSTEFGNITDGGVNADGVLAAGDDPAVGPGELRTDMNATDGTAPGADTNIWLASYPEGSLGGGVNSNTSKIECYPAANSKNIYVCLQLKLSTGYSLHTNGEKLWYPTVVDGVGAYLTASMLAMRVKNGVEATEEQASSGTIEWEVFPQTDRGTQAWYYDSTLTRNTWHTVEAYFVGNTTGNTDGQAQVWVDGVQQFNITNVNWFSGENGFFNIARVDGTRGGGDSLYAVPTGGQTRSFARLAIYWSGSTL